MSKHKKYDDDDGRVVANMDIEGMPWNNGYNRLTGGFFKKSYRKKIEEDMLAQQQNDEQIVMTKRETRMLVLNAVVAVMLIAGVFALAAFIFIWFCVNVWFK